MRRSEGTIRRRGTERVVFDYFGWKRKTASNLHSADAKSGLPDGCFFDSVASLRGSYVPSVGV
jgi:hypothetical protein